jgi:hypothetical protein
MGWLSFLSRLCPCCSCVHVPLAPKEIQLPELKVLSLHDGNIPRFCASPSTQKSVRVVVISDTHGRHAELEPLPSGDVLIHAGDFSVYHKACTAESVKAFDDWLGTQTQYKHRFVTCGNHEVALDAGGLDPPPPLKNATWLHCSHADADGLRIFGAPFRPGRGSCYNAEAFGRKVSELESVWSRMGDGGRPDIVVTHGPPYGVLDEERTGHMGDWILLEWIGKLRPQVSVFGHVHGTHGGRLWTPCKDEPVAFINASTLDGRGGLNPPVVFDITPRASQV